jgi:acetyltransferase-like isoleucine patch superfamily enzyme
MLRIVSRLLTYILLKDSEYFSKKLLLHPVIVGPVNRVHIGKMTDLQNTILNVNSGSVFIGDHTFCGHNCMILTGKHDVTLVNRERQQQYLQSGADIHIGKGVWIASGAIILGGVSIGDHAVIAAGAVVNKSCPDRALYAGVPAKKIRDIEHD